MAMDQHKEVKDIGTDAWQDILSQLPTMTLLGVKGVSKEWHRLISDRSFIVLQLNSTEPISGYFIQEPINIAAHENKDHLNYVTAERRGTEVQRGVLDFLPESVLIQSSVNGLICCCSFLPSQEPKIYVCNPINKEWISLPYPDPDPDYPEPDTNSRITLSLCFQPLRDCNRETTVFEVIRLSRRGTHYSFDVYSSRMMEWRKAVVTCPNLGLFVVNNRSIVIDRKVYWLTSRDRVLMLDLENESTSSIKLPHPIAHYLFVYKVCLGEWEGQLHYVLITRDTIRLWVLMDHLASFWELRFDVALHRMEGDSMSYMSILRDNITQRIDIDYQSVEALTFQDGILLIRISEDIHLFDFRTTEMKRLCSRTELDQMYPIVHPYRASLVPLMPVALRSPVVVLPSAQIVGTEFVNQYYDALSKSPEMAYMFYGASSVLSRPNSAGVMTSVSTLQVINEEIQSLASKNCNPEIETVDAEMSYERGIIVLVTGSLTGMDSVKRRFTQTFFLAPKEEEEGYFALNDVLRFVEESEQLEMKCEPVNADRDSIPVDPLTSISEPTRVLPNLALSSTTPDSEDSQDTEVEGEIRPESSNALDEVGSSGFQRKNNQGSGYFGGRGFGRSFFRNFRAYLSRRKTKSSVR